MFISDQWFPTGVLHRWFPSEALRHPWAPLKSSMGATKLWHQLLKITPFVCKMLLGVANCFLTSKVSEDQKRLKNIVSYHRAHCLISCKAKYQKRFFSWLSQYLPWLTGYIMFLYLRCFQQPLHPQQQHLYTKGYYNDNNIKIFTVNLRQRCNNNNI